MVDRCNNPPPLEYGREPSLQEKIDGLLGEARREGVSQWTAAPPLVRLLWRFNFDVPPPLYWSFATTFLVFGLIFAVCFLAIIVLVFGEEWHRALISTPFAALIFGLGMAWVMRNTARRLRLPKWGGSRPASATEQKRDAG